MVRKFQNIGAVRLHEPPEGSVLVESRWLHFLSRPRESQRWMAAANRHARHETKDGRTAARRLSTFAAHTPACGMAFKYVCTRYRSTPHRRSLSIHESRSC